MNVVAIKTNRMNVAADKTDRMNVAAQMQNARGTWEMINSILNIIHIVNMSPLERVP